MKKRVLVGMSGGVDSTVAALLLQKEGYEVEGVYMKLHHKPGYHEENYAKAKRVGDYLGVEVHFLDLSREFDESVYQYFVQSYKEGITPNPCVVCNRTIKFGKMLEFADTLGIEKVATGHYVKSNGHAILMSEDKNKDQSYFLAQIDPLVLSRVLFPLGSWKKEDVKALAEEIPLFQDIATQKESTEICFVENSYDEVLAKHMDIDMPGETVDTEGNVVGTHKGYMHYTIGKRRGFFVNGAHDPHFVVEIKPKENQIVVGKREKLEVHTFKVEGLSWLVEDIPLVCEVKVRYRTHAIGCEVIQTEEGSIEVKLHEPVFGLAKGQIAAFYAKEKLLGGGVIV